MSDRMEELDTLLRALDDFALELDGEALAAKLSVMAAAFRNEAALVRQAASLIRAQAEEIARLEEAAGEVWDEAYAEGAGDTAGWEKETSHAVLRWLDKEGDGFDIHHPDGNTTDAIIQGLYDAKRIGNLTELRAQSERERVLVEAASKLMTLVEPMVRGNTDFSVTWRKYVREMRAALTKAQP